MIIDLFGRIELNPTQEAAIGDEHRATLVQGGFGSGKSVCLQGKVNSYAMDNPRANMLIVRRTYEQVVDSVIADFELKFSSSELSDRLWPQEILRGGRWDTAFSVNDRRPTLEYINGAVGHFRGVIHDGREDPKKFGSIPFGAAFLEEMSDFKDPTTFNYLDGRCRQKTTADGYNRLFLVGNPPPANHWSQYEFIELLRLKPEVAKLRSHYILPTEENRQHLPAGYIENMMATYSRSWIKRYLLGHAGIIEEGQAVLKGVYAPETATGAPWHNAEGPLPVVRGWPIFRGWDFGVAYASCVWLQYVGDPFPQIRILHELTERETSAKHFGPPVKVISAVKFPGFRFIDIGDPSGRNRSLSDRRSPFEVLRDEHGIDVKPAITNEIEQRKDAMIGLFSRMAKAGQPYVQISNIPATEFLRDALEVGWAYPKDSAGYVGQIHPIKNEYSHAADALAAIAVSLELETANLVKRKRERVSRRTIQKVKQPSSWATG